LFAFELPWQRGADGRAAMAHGMSATPPLRNYYPKIHPVLEEAILKCLVPEPDNRFHNMGQFLKAIRRVQHEDA
jgi:hypothetical protein